MSEWGYVPEGAAGFVGRYTGEFRLVRGPDGRAHLQRQEQRLDTGQCRWVTQPTVEIDEDAVKRGGTEWE